MVFTTATTEAYGSTRVLQRHAKALIAAGSRVAVAYESGGHSANARSTVLTELGQDGAELLAITGLASWRSVIPFGRTVRTLAQADPDVIVSTQVRDAAPAAALARRLGVPFVALVQNHPNFGGRPPIAKMKRLIYRQVLRSADRVVCVADHVATIAERDLGVDPARLGVVPNLIELGPLPVADADSRAEIRRSLDVADDAFLIVNVGRFHRQKGQLDLVEALSAVVERDVVNRDLIERDVVVAFVGDIEASRGARYHAEVKEKVAAAGLDDRVRWAGYRNDVPAVLEAADLYVSSALWEAGPSLAVLEAMSAQCAVLATDHGDRVGGFVDEVHGLYVPAGDPAALARGLKWMMERTGDERRSMGRNARQLVEERQRRLEDGAGLAEQLQVAVASARR